MNRLKQLIHELHRRSIWQVVGVYLAMSWGVLNAVDVLTGFAGLPDWTPTMAVVLLLIGLPIVTATAVVQKGLPGAVRTDEPEGEAGDPVEAPPSTGGEGADGVGVAGPVTDFAQGWRALFTWRNAILGGFAAGMLLLATGGAYLAMWTLGIGPVGSLVAQGVLEARDPVLLAEFEDRSGADLAVVVTEALSVDLGSSQAVTLLGGDAIQNGLRLMELEAGSPVTEDVAREMAVRLNLKAFIAGDVSRVGTRYLLVARIVSPETGEDLVGFREEASDDDDLLPAIDRLSQRLREKMGESLRDIRLGAPLEEVTTGSFEALRLLTEAEAAEERGDYETAMRLLEEAVALDPAFAMAYRKMSVLYFNSGGSAEATSRAATLAYEHRDRLTERERYLTEAYYFRQVVNDVLAASRAYQNVLRIAPDDQAALNNYALLLFLRARWEEALDLLERAHATGHPSSVALFNRALTRLMMGDREGAGVALDDYVERFPSHLYVPWAAILFAAWDRDVDEALRLNAELVREGTTIFSLMQPFTEGSILSEAGRYREALLTTRSASVMHTFERTYGVQPLHMGEVELRLVVGDDPEGARAAVSRHLERVSFAEAAQPDRAWASVVVTRAALGEVESVRAMLGQWPTTDGEHGGYYEIAEAMTLLAEGRADAALERIEDAGRTFDCDRCVERQRAEILAALDRAGEAIEIWERVRAAPIPLETSGYLRVVALKRLGPLYERVGDTAAAIETYRALAEMWADADPELQPQVSAARARIAALGG